MSKPIKFVAHRGLSANKQPNARFMENTLPAVRRAVRLGYRSIEVDVQLTADRVPILWHDDGLYTSSGAVDVTRIAFKELKRIVCTNTLYRRDGQLWEPQRKRLDTLTELLARFPSIQVCIELKVCESRKRDRAYKQELVACVLEHIQQRRATNYVFLSFDAVVCKLLSTQAPPGTRVMVLTQRNLQRARRIAQTYQLSGFVFDGTMVRDVSPPPHTLSKYKMTRWSYNAPSPFTAVSIIDVPDGGTP